MGDEEQARRAEDKIRRLISFHERLLAQVRAQHEALDAMQRQLDDVLRMVEATRASWPGSGREAG